MIDHIGTTTCAAPNHVTGALVILASITHSSCQAQKTLDAHLLETIAAWLSSEEIRSVNHAGMQRQLVMVVANLVDLVGGAATGVAQQLFHVLLHLQGSDQLDAYTQKQIYDVRPLALWC
jgi:hypothetical protein